MQGGRVLFVCTGNQCRSPMAEALLRSQLPIDCDIEVASAGTIGDGTPPPPNAVETMAEIHLDIAGRPSRPLTKGEVEAADLIVAMERDHLVAAASLSPSVLERTFTFTGLLHRARAASARMPVESVGDWAYRLGAGRTRQAILTLPSSGDVPDPMGRSFEAFERVRNQLQEMTEELSAYLTGYEPPRKVQAEERGERRRFGRRPRW